MPPSVEKRLIKRIRKLMWDEKTMSPVNIETLYAPINIGGRALLDIKARNEAIAVMWLKTYLDLSPTRPTWALVADSLMAENTPMSNSNVSQSIKMNYFLQSWKTRQTGNIPRSIKCLLSTAKKFGLRAEGIAFFRRDQKVHANMASPRRQTHPWEE
ncbi:hypothetical protein CPB84DRAFT_1678498 [Gymnopilus junonius]|uniref:Uncharacterized protein n=1 Tax=Gymnopilus junonius TaxID=109634 RepID=A0A9P5NN94_GYMJU|nr:hypothetical protein CPB84DRAFT_1678498 [Gymnopilus junonius]